MPDDAPKDSPRALTVEIDLPVSATEAYAYLSDPLNLPDWAPNFAKSVERRGEDWVAQMDEGEVTFRYAPENPFGVCDHWVTMPDGSEVYNPMRVLAVGEASMLTFTVFRRPGWDDARLRSDAELVRSDLGRLRDLLTD